VAKALKVPLSRSVVYLQRLRSLDGHPFLIDSVYVRSDRCPGLEEMDLTDKSLFSILESRYHRVIVRSHRILTIATAEAWVARMLGIPRGSPLFRLTDLSFEGDGEPILNSQILITNERAEFDFDLVRSRGGRKEGSLSVAHSAHPTLNRTGNKRQARFFRKT
jgi:GntR family transcriptional regulator